MSWRYESKIEQAIKKMQAAERIAVKRGSEYVKGNAVTYSRKRSGDTARGFETKVAMEGNIPKGVIYNNKDNAIYEEFGTGIYAEKGGRKTPWVYKDKRTGKFYRTRGKKGTKAFRNAGENHKSETARIMISAMKGGMK
ncbi:MULTISPECIES: hypothetical protein [Bacillus cereus group]|uniref:HK97 gp10 family phage protein n=1 Tax=Bacillus cytotoxicus (strain DSM 22905 / CIP 110041 / 391-98 / NVH 391-98) TaxID=315749 RepID=A7GSR3_BACCN|nr:MULTISPECIES: hypothetical protein [Bacillus cereus group]ABS23171.1 hypothetical protein Bcer98_2940 [Bacillus cytotoxicus NVH 391-98]AWC33265.1 hypothetical protein CG482_013350 [Bacillus cytotoxicus]AWC33824.1 hypothetical protein CG482_016405 [Bacillus cytotoxicus]AWC37814.1 hypothetical protein CG481_016235 [Bacillus cytotoxicus]AWC45798.1 hypothetical protein CG479_015650 [Bacillus cytotoxicus]